MIDVEKIWLATEPVDMRAGPDTLLAKVVEAFGEAQAHHAYLFTNKRCNREDTGFRQFWALDADTTFTRRAISLD